MTKRRLARGSLEGATQNWLLIGSNAITFALMGLILALKLRHG